MAFELDLTEYATKYGPIPGERFSGITPMTPTFPQPRTKELRQAMLAREEFQRQALGGFTSQELANLDVFTLRNLKDGNLQNGILSVMARDRWETRPPNPRWKRNHMYPLKDGSGFWTVDNPGVWAVLEPCLRLATRHLMSMCCLPWVRNLFNIEHYKFELANH
jgi:hypothetical protein